MELGNEPRPCSLYRNQATCCNFASGKSGEPERHVREAVASFLVGCEQRLHTATPCLAMDLGANNGWFSAYMLQLGAHVVSVEPQQDLAQALRDTVALNCWSDRSVVFNGFACADPPCRENYYMPNCIGGFRMSYPAGNSSKGCARRHGLPEYLGSRTLESLLFDTLAPAKKMAAAGGVVEFDLLKLDADGPEGYWLAKLDKLMLAGRLRIRALVVEGSGLRPSTMHRLQHVHGFDFWRLDALDGRRLIRPDGWDAYSPPGTIAPLMRYREEHAFVDGLHQKYSPDGFERRHEGGNETRDLYEDEMFGVRAMRHVFRVKENTTVHGWYRLLQPISFKGWAPQWLMTTDRDMLLPTHASIPCQGSIECRNRNKKSAAPTDKQAEPPSHGRRLQGLHRWTREAATTSASAALELPVWPQCRTDGTCRAHLEVEAACSAASKAREAALLASRGRKRDYFAALQEGTRPLNVTGIERNAPDFRIESTASIGFVGDSLTRELAEAVAAIAPKATVHYYPEPLVEMSHKSRYVGLHKALHDIDSCALDALFVGGFGHWYLKSLFYGSTRVPPYRNHAERIAPQLDRIECIATQTALPVVFVGIVPLDADMLMLYPGDSVFVQFRDMNTLNVWARVERTLEQSTPDYDPNFHFLHLSDLTTQCPGMRCDGQHFKAPHAVENGCRNSLSVYFARVADFLEGLRLSSEGTLARRRRRCNERRLQANTAPFERIRRTCLVPAYNFTGQYRNRSAHRVAFGDPRFGEPKREGAAPANGKVAASDPESWRLREIAKLGDRTEIHVDG